MSAAAYRGIHVKQEPRTGTTPVVCFVCGSAGAEHSIHCKPRERGPFFPFLEHHQPPHGADRPTADGIVLACVVCHSFLVQQWESYERTRTPHNKRLYWLKRADNGPYAGMELDVQVEYASQFLGMQSLPGGYAAGPGDGQQKPRVSLDLDRPAPRVRRDSQLPLRIEKSEMPEENGALDLSMPSRASSCSSSTVSPPPGGLDACYVCGEEFVRGAMVNVYAKPIANCPFFPSLISHPKPSRAQPMDSSGRVRVCEACHKNLLHQWDLYQQRNIPHTERNYHLGNNRSSTAHSVSLLPGGVSNCSREPSFICFTCGLEYPVSVQRHIWSRFNLDGEPFFTFIERITPFPGALMPSSEGKAQVCSVCCKSLFRQHRVYEISTVPEEKRIYKIPNEAPKAETSVLRQHLCAPPEKVEREGSSFGCYLCEKLTPADALRSIDTVPQVNSMHFSFIREMPRPLNAKPIDHHGCVLVCYQCQSSLRSQWESFEASQVPHCQRQYGIKSQSHKLLNFAQSHASDESSVRNTSSALHIQVSSPEVNLDFARQGGNHEPLLTTVQTLPLSTLVTSQARMPSPGTSGHLPSRSGDSTVASAAARIHSLKMNLEDVQSPQSQNILRIFSPLEHTVSRPPLLVATTCFICAEYSPPGFTFPIRTFPPPSGIPNQPPSDQRSSPPFFPFLSKHVPPVGYDHILEDSKVLACVFCFHSLMAQWLAYETSPHPEDSNCWQRKYNTHHYVCYICGITTYRKRVRSITVREFPFLMEHPRPAGALTLHSGESVVTCLTCCESLTSQWKDFERMKVPVEMRKYNWIVLPPPPEDESPRNNHHVVSRDSTTPTRASSVGLETKHGVLQEATSLARHDNQQGTSGAALAASQGLPHGSKPLPLTMQAHCGGSHKPIARTMATVSPLHRVPSHANSVISSYAPGNNPALNATRTSSFAAALRKLAKQAVDPILEKDLSPITPVSSPALGQQSATPKRVVPSVYLGSHQSALSVASPPIVTMAPTQEHVGHLSDSRKSMDLAGLSHSANSSSNHLEPLSLKLEVGKGVTLHTEKQDDHSLGTKDLLISSPLSQIRPPAVSRPHDSLPSSRGFQPYRMVDDMRHSIPPHLSPYDHAAAAAAAAATYPYHPAFLPPHHLPHPPYRLDESLYLERYGLLRPPMVPLPTPSGMLSHHSVSLFPPGRYPSDLLAQPVGLISPSSAVLSHERLKQEEDHRHRERDREFSQEQEQDRESEGTLGRGNGRRVIHSPLPVSLTRNSSPPGGRLGSITQGTPRDLVIRKPATPVPTTGMPLNLALHSSSVSSQDSHEMASHHSPHELDPWPSRHQTTPNQIDLGNMPPSSEPEEGLMYRHSLSSHQEFNHAAMDRSSLLARPTSLEFDRNIVDLAKHSTSFQVRNNNPHPTELSQKRGCDSSLYAPPPQQPGSQDFNGILSGDSTLRSSLMYLRDQERNSAINKDRKSVIAAERRTKEKPERTHYTPLAVRNSWPVPSVLQDEGMHTRLLETEKSRNGTVTQLSRGDYRLDHPPTNVATHSISEKRDILGHRTIADVHASHHIAPRELHANVAGPPEQMVLPRVVSRLDMEEERVRRSRINGMYRTNESGSDSEEENDENRLARLLVVTKGPPLKLDINPKKLGFLKNLNLTTHYRRKEIELDKYLSRRKVLQECRVSPTIDVEDTEHRKMPLLDQPTRYRPEDLCKEVTYAEKSEFLHTFELLPKSREKREEREVVWKAIMDERLRRKKTVYPALRNALEGVKCTNGNEQGSRVLKRKFPAGGHHPNGLVLDFQLPKEQTDPPAKVPSVVLAQPTKPVPISRPMALLPSKSTDATPTPTPPALAILPLSLQQRPLSSETKDQERRVIFLSNSAKQNPQKQKAVKEFVQEFHKSVLQTTQQQLVEQNRSWGGDTSIRHNHSSHAAVQVAAAPMPSGGTGKDHPETDTPSEPIHRRDLERRIAYHWPGIETVMEAYEQYSTEQKHEREFLMERCQHIRTKQQDLNRDAEQLSQRMSELVQLKKQLDDERQCHQSAIDNLKRCLRQLR